MLVVMSNEHFDLSGRRALVTGASRGIGRAIAFGLASAGADVALAARDKERLTEIAVGIRDLGQNACVVPLDVSKLDTVGPAIDAAAAGLGGLDVLVNNAGVNGPGGFDVMDAREFDRVLDTNFGGVLFLGKLLPFLLRVRTSHCKSAGRYVEELHSHERLDPRFI